MQRNWCWFLCIVWQHLKSCRSSHILISILVHISGLLLSKAKNNPGDIIRAVFSDGTSSSRGMEDHFMYNPRSFFFSEHVHVDFWSHYNWYPEQEKLTSEKYFKKHQFHLSLPRNSFVKELNTELVNLLTPPEQYFSWIQFNAEAAVRWHCDSYWHALSLIINVGNETTHAFSNSHVI